MTTTDDVAALDFTQVLECIDPDHRRLHAPFATASWLVRERACSTMPRAMTAACTHAATLLLCEDGYNLYRAVPHRTCPTCDTTGQPAAWIEQAIPVATHPGWDWLLCPSCRATYASPSGNRWPTMRHLYIEHHRHHLETP